MELPSLLLHQYIGVLAYARVVILMLAMVNDYCCVDKCYKVVLFERRLMLSDVTYNS